MGYFQWIRNKASSIYTGTKAKVGSLYNGTKEVLAEGYKVVKFVGSGFASHEFRHGFADLFTQFWQGFARVLDLPLLVRTFLTRPQTARAYAYGQGFAMLHMAPAMVYSCLLPQLDVMLREAGRDNLATAIDVGAVMVCIYNFVDAYADDIACGAALASASAKETAVEKTSESVALNAESNPLMQACVHGGPSHFSGNVNSTIYGIGYWLQLLALRHLVKKGEYLSLPLQVMVYAQGFMDYPAGAVGVCTKDRKILYNQNNAYLAGLGVSYLTWLYVVETLVERYTGANGFFVQRALGSLVGLHFIMVSILSRDKKLPGTEEGMDVLEVNRNLTDFLVMQGVKQVRRYCKGKPESDWVQGTKETLHTWWNNPLLYLPRKLLIPSRLQSYDHLPLRATFRLYLGYCANDIVATLNKILEVRESGTNQFLSWVLPDIKGGQIEQFKMIMDPYLDRPLREWVDYLERVSKDDYQPSAPAPVQNTSQIAKVLRRNPMVAVASPPLMLDLPPLEPVGLKSGEAGIPAPLEAASPVVVAKSDVKEQAQRPLPPSAPPTAIKKIKTANTLKRRPLNKEPDDEQLEQSRSANGLNK